MKTKTKNSLFTLAWELNIFCVGVAVVVVGAYWTNQFMEAENLQPTIARAIEVIAPNLLDFLTEN